MREYLALLVKSLMRLRYVLPGGRRYSDSWVPADSIRLFWFIQTYHDLPELRRTLADLRRLYTDAEVMVVSDGDPDPEIEAVCADHSVAFVLRPRLFGVERGGEVVQQMLEAFLATRADILVKIDPDTHVRRRFSIMPSPLDSSIYGTVESGGSSSNRLTSIQGGCMIVPRVAARRIAESRLLESGRLKPPAIEWAVNGVSRARAASGLTSADKSLAWACRELGLECVDHPEVFSRYRPSLMDTMTQGPVAVAHPRFELGQLTDPNFYFRGLRTSVGTLVRGRSRG